MNVIDTAVAPEQTNTTPIVGWTAAELYEAIVRDEIPYILDVRNEADYARWRVEGRAGLTSVNIPYFAFVEEEETAVAQTPTDRPIFVVCAKEGSAQFVAEILHQHGRAVSYLKGGITSWGDHYDIRELLQTKYGRIVQVARPARGDLSFVLLSEGSAAVVDPLRHTDHYIDVINAAQAQLTHILDTHAHADHISGGPALATETGAGYYLHPYDAIHPLDMLPATLPYNYLSDGQSFQVGQLTITTIWFPGHTLGQVNYLATDPDGHSYLFTGDGIFLQSFGRPDLGGRGEAWTPILYESLFTRLPQHVHEDTLILPAHFSQQDEGDENGLFAAPYRVVQMQNEALQPRSLSEFTAYVLGSLPHFPPEYVQIKRVNAGLVVPSEEEASALELGKNICALSD